MILPIQLITPPLSERHHPRRAVELVEAVLDGALARSSPCLVVAPAGLATVESEDEAFEQAEAIRVIARRTGVALIFGLDVGPPTPSAGRLFACYGGAPVLWPAVASRGFPPDGAHRLLHLGETLVLPLFASEALDPLAPRRIAQMEGVGAIVVLSHGGATPRWAPALERLEKLAPVVVASHHGGVGTGYASTRLAATWLTVRDVVDATERHEKAAA